MSKSVTYVGPEHATVDADGTVWPGVRIPIDDVGNFAAASSGEVVELPDHIADELVERGQAVHTSAASESGAPTTHASKDEWAAYRAAQGHVVDGLTKQELVELPDTAPEG